MNAGSPSASSVSCRSRFGLIGLCPVAAGNGCRVHCGALAGLIESLERAKAAGQLSRRLRAFAHPAQLVVEIGQLPVSRGGAVLSNCSTPLRASTALTSNKAGSGTVLGDEAMAAALVDSLHLGSGRSLRRWPRGREAGLADLSPPKAAGRRNGCVGCAWSLLREDQVGAHGALCQTPSTWVSARWGRPAIDTGAKGTFLLCTKGDISTLR